MNFEEENTAVLQNNTFQDIDAMYLSVEKQRIREAILYTDTEKFLLFTRMIRINSTLKNAIITHKNL
ncbi:MAG: hypothetical protein H0V14_00330 [Chitinophagaceae bacterium]|jgi:hypothetical protein|nr:hypothetical protein [Chitinophagaceae bacterium]